MSKLNEEFHALMQRVLTGSDEAARELFDGYAPHLLQVIRLRLNSRMRSRFDSQDFAQDVWASFFAESPQKRVFETPEELVAFLTRLARNKVIDAARQRSQKQQHAINRTQSIDSQRFDKEQLAANQMTPSQIVMSQEEWRVFLLKIDDQPLVYRRVFVLLRAGKSQIEIAEELGMSTRTVRRIIDRLVPEKMS